MYLDYILFAAGGGLLTVALCLLVYLWRSRRKSRNYQRILREETERLDVVSTLKNAETAELRLGTVPLEEVVKQGRKTAKITVSPTEPLFHTKALSKSLPDGTVSITSVEVGIALDISPLTGKYELLREIHGGGMSRVFLARHVKLGNEWIVKFVEQAELANEAEVLKRLNHISLPQIIDIFQTEQGAFLVERYIEGYTLSDVLALGQGIKESQICDWGLQLAQVLHYLHTLETPIIHCDLKPSNIMVTYDNRLVLIDFGVSKRQGVDDEAGGITYRYAAPEQFRGWSGRPELIREYFGSLPPGHDRWPIDQRTDLYSVGVILRELAGQGGALSPELAGIIKKCLEILPEKRFSSAKELAEVLEKAKGRQAVMVKSLVLRQVMAACCGLCLASGLVTSASAVYVNRMENLSVVSMDPGRAVVTVQQGVKLLIQKTAPSGKETFLDPQKIEWSYSGENIARLDGDRLVGLNVGETVLYGVYRDKVIELAVTVTEPPEENTAVSLRYADGGSVSLYAGGGERECADGPLAEASFVSPESLAADGEALWLSDSGVLRMIRNGIVETMPLTRDYWTAEQVRVYNGKPCVLTGPWEAEDGLWYAFTWAGDSELFYRSEADWTCVTDFAFSSDGTLWFIQQNLAFSDSVLNRLDAESGECVQVLELPEGVRCMAFDEADNLYISVPEEGVILRVGHEENQWTYFAGELGARHFVDGELPNFYRPTALAAFGNALYVLDFDTVRRITIEGAGALFTETVAGVPEADTNPEVRLGPGGEAVLPASERAALVAADGRLLLGDPKNSSVYEIVTRR